MRRIFDLTILSLALFACSTAPRQDTNLDTPVNESFDVHSDNIDIEHFSSLFRTELRRSAASVGDAIPQTGDFKAGTIFSLVRDPGILAHLEQAHYALGSRLDNAATETVSNDVLMARSPIYKSIMDVLGQDLDQLAVDETRAHPGNPAGVGVRYANRIFDKNWFRSPIARFELTGLVNRLDRVAFAADTCGEIRLLYRLSYDQGPKGVRSRLPMTVLVKYQVKNNSANPKRDFSDCKKMLTHWTYPATSDNLADWMLKEGPLDPVLMQDAQLKSVEINLQAMRIPSTARAGLGGHATYLMRVFSPDATGKWAPMPLENTPDLQKLAANPSLMQKMKSMMKDPRTLNYIDMGIFLLPNEFLATKAFSYSPLGLARKENRLYSEILQPTDFAPGYFESADRRFVKSPEAAIKRLNDLSCVGCHQGRATAGFHFVGIDPLDTHPFNALIFEGSGHFRNELIRRQKYLEDLADRTEFPDPGRDFSYAPTEGQPAGLNNFCGLPGSHSFGHWTCEEGLRCTLVDSPAGVTSTEDNLGICLAPKMPAGSPCIPGQVTQTNHDTDVYLTKTPFRCGLVNGCSDFKGGFPSGMCHTSCGALDPNLEVCANAAGPGFNACVLSGQPFDNCLADSFKSGRGLCGDDLACRNDYICARTYGGKGGCSPTYFMFQLRLDGHPDPMKTLTSGNE